MAAKAGLLARGEENEGLRVGVPEGDVRGGPDMLVAGLWGSERAR